MPFLSNTKSELVLQASNGILTDSDKADIQAEVDQLKQGRGCSEQEHNPVQVRHHRIPEKKHSCHGVLFLCR